MTTPTEGLSARFPRLSSRGVLLGLTVPQLVLVGIAVAAFVGGVFLAGISGVLLVSPVVVAASVSALVPVRGRPIVEWAPIVAGREVRRATDQTQFRVRPTKPFRPELEGSLGLPGSAASLRVFSTVDGSAMVYDAGERVVLAVVRVTAPAFRLLDSDDQRQHVAGWGRVLAGACHGARVARVQVLERTIPDSGDALDTWWAGHGQRDGSWASNVYEDLISAAGPASERHETYLCLSIGLKRAARQVRQHGGGMRGAAKLLEMEKAAFVRGLMAAGVSVEGWLAPRELAAVVRVAYDPDAAVAIDRRNGARDGEPGVRVGSAGPVAVDEEWDHLRSDSGFHTVYWISEWPRVEAHAAFLHALVFLPGVRRSLSVVYEPVPVDEALRQIRSEKVNHAVDAAQRQRLGQLTTEAQIQERQDVARRERELVAGHGDVRFCGFVAVSAPDRRALEEACGKIETASTQAYVDVRRLVGQQAEAFLAAALPFGRGLR